MQPTSQQAIAAIADIAGLALTAEDIEFIRQPELAGLILFTRNYESPKQLQALCQSILAERPDFLICVDHEGGRVQRFRHGFTHLPPMLNLAKLHADNPLLALELAYELGWLMAAELRVYSVHLSFAPVLDLDYGLSSIIGDRAFGDTPELVVKLAGRFIDGMREAGMASVGKHFPGHGGVVADSHLALPIDERAGADIEQDIAPFSRLIEAQKIDGIMPAHVLYTNLDKEHTAGFSQYWLQDRLREQLGFQGIIFSDDLTMEGAAHLGSYAQRAKAAITAGANAILVCNNRSAAQEVVDTIRECSNPPLSLQNWQTQAQPIDTQRQQQIRLKLEQLGW